jgi:transposase-like protein
MFSFEFLERLTLHILAITACLLLWQRYQKQLYGLWKQARMAARRPRKWKAKTPADCPACRSGVRLSIRPIRRDAQPWREQKSRQGRKKRIRTQGHACPNPACCYFGVTDEQVHAVVGNGKRGKYAHIQALKCQCCRTSFSSRRNTPLYHLKTHTDRIGICLWLLAEGVDVSVGSEATTISPDLMRAFAYPSRA